MVLLRKCCQFENKTVQILLEMRTNLLFDGSIDGCLAQEVEATVSIQFLIF